jgi:hypothetical protein
MPPSGLTTVNKLYVGDALLGPQEDRLKPPEDRKRGSFAMYIKPIARLSVVKTQQAVAERREGGVSAAENNLCLA